MANKTADFDYSKLGFIFGAGAHVPYKMPTSFQLTEKIKRLNHPKIIISSLEKHKNDSDEIAEKKSICRMIRALEIIPQPRYPQSTNEHGINISNALDTFLDKFAGSQVYSIDSFLAQYIKEQNAKDKDLITTIGKLILIYFISKFENETPIGYQEFNWIQFIINEYLKDKDTRDKFFKNPPKIYTFNYDRILEKSLKSHLENFHFIGEKEAISMIDSLDIKHIYGDIGPYHESFDIKDAKKVRDALIRIRVIGEERLQTTPEISQQVYKDLKDLKRVYILGYGFDSLNNKVLFSEFLRFFDNRNTTIPKLGRSHPVDAFPTFISTNIGITKEDSHRIAKELENLRIDLNRSELNFDKIDALNLLKVVSPLQTASIERKIRATRPSSDFWHDDE